MYKLTDAQDGSRQSVAIWNDLSGQRFQDPSVFGVLTLVKSGDQIPDLEDPETPGAPVEPGKLGKPSDPGKPGKPGEQNEPKKT